MSLAAGSGEEVVGGTHGVPGEKGAEEGFGPKGFGGEEAAVKKEVLDAVDEHEPVAKDDERSGEGIIASVEVGKRENEKEDEEDEAGVNAEVRSGLDGEAAKTCNRCGRGGFEVWSVWVGKDQ